MRCFCLHAFPLAFFFVLCFEVLGVIFEGREEFNLLRISLVHVYNLARYYLDITNSLSYNKEVEES